MQIEQNAFLASFPAKHVLPTSTLVHPVTQLYSSTTANVFQLVLWTTTHPLESVSPVLLCVLPATP